MPLFRTSRRSSIFKAFSKYSSQLRQKIWKLTNRFSFNKSTVASRYDRSKAKEIEPSRSSSRCERHRMIKNEWSSMIGPGQGEMCSVSPHSSGNEISRKEVIYVFTNALLSWIVTLEDKFQIEPFNSCLEDAKVFSKFL